MESAGRIVSVRRALKREKTANATAAPAMGDERPMATQMMTRMR